MKEAKANRFRHWPLCYTRIGYACGRRPLSSRRLRGTRRATFPKGEGCFRCAARGIEIRLRRRHDVGIVPYAGCAAPIKQRRGGACPSLFRCGGSRRAIIQSPLGCGLRVVWSADGQCPSLRRKHRITAQKFCGCAVGTSIARPSYGRRALGERPYGCGALRYGAHQCLLCVKGGGCGAAADGGIVF